MRIRLQLPPLDLNVNDEAFGSEELTRRLASEFQDWLARHLPTQAWREFAEERYPQLQDQDAVAIGTEHESSSLDNSSTYFLQPAAGESLPDLLRTIAQLDPKLAAAVTTIVTEKSLDEAVVALFEYMLGGRSRREAIKDLQEKLDFPENFGFEYTEHPNKASDQLVKRRDPRGAGEIVVVLDANLCGSYIGEVQDVFGGNVRVKFLTGAASEAIDTVDEKYIVHVGEIHSALVTYSMYDDMISKTVTKTDILESVVFEIDVTRGVLVGGKLPTKEYFKEWVQVQHLSGMAQ